MRGIYEIYCIRTNKRYIGSSKDVQKRWLNHITELENQTHHNYKLQRAWNSYGPVAFVFKLLEEVPLEGDLFVREEFCMNSFPFDSLYNILKKPGDVPLKKNELGLNEIKEKGNQNNGEYVWGDIR